MKYIRHSALGHNIGGQYRIKVIFKNSEAKFLDDKKDKYRAFWMDRKTYDTFPLGVDIELDYFIRAGECIETDDLDIDSHF